MIKRILPLLLFIVLMATLGMTRIQQENHAPVVKLTAPANNASFIAGSPINFQIAVSDKEDGESKFDEINVKEVLLEVQYVKDKSRLKALLNKPMADDATGLAVMRTSNCFNCHDFNGKSIGPSLLEINKRYPATKANTDSLVSRIKNGSANIWGGKEKMPSHPELSVEQIKSTVLWLFKNAADPNVNYYYGTQGLLRNDQNRKGTYILTASYVDHGLKTAPDKRLKGQNRVVIVIK